MTWNRGILLLILALAGALAYWLLAMPKAPRLALQYLNRQLTCVDKLNTPAGLMTVTSDDDGNTLSVVVDGGSSYKLNYTGGQESYRNGDGQTLAFGTEMSFSGFFGDKHGHCA